MAEVKFKNKKTNKEKLLSYGFREEDDKFVYETEIFEGQFMMIVYISSNIVTTKVIDLSLDEEYILHTIPNAVGAFVGKVRYEYEEILKDIESKCFEDDFYKSECTKQIIKYVKETYGDELEFLWSKFPDSAVLRRKDSKKWYAVISVIQKRKLGLDSDEMAEIIVLKASKEEVPTLVDNKKYFPGYHMNKKSWITLCLDGSVEVKEICGRVDVSYGLVGK